MKGKHKQSLIAFIDTRLMHGMISWLVLKGINNINKTTAYIFFCIASTILFENNLRKFLVCEFFQNNICLNLTSLTNSVFKMLFFLFTYMFSTEIFQPCFLYNNILNLSFWSVYLFCLGKAYSSQSFIIFSYTDVFNILFKN